MEEQHAPEDGKNYHSALDDGHHIKGDQQNGAGVEVKADAGDKAEHQDSRKTADIRPDARQLSSGDARKQWEKCQQGGSGKDGQVAVNDLHAVRDHFLRQYMTAGADAGQEEKSGQQDILLEKRIQRSPVPGDKENPHHAQKDAEKLSGRQLFLEKEYAG